MLLQIDFKSGKPVYLQLVDQIRYAAASGGLRTGEPLPSIRPLAEECASTATPSPRLTRNWKARASSRRFPARAVFSRRAIRRSPSPRAQKILIKEIDEAVVAAHHLQVDRDAFLALVKERLDGFERKVKEKSDND